MDGSPVRYTNYDVGEPDPNRTNCIEMKNRNGKWRDWSCYTYNAYVCKVAKSKILISKILSMSLAMYNGLEKSEKSEISRLCTIKNNVLFLKYDFLFQFHSHLELLLEM